MEHLTDRHWRRHDERTTANEKRAGEKFVESISFNVLFCKNAGELVDRDPVVALGEVAEPLGEIDQLARHADLGRVVDALIFGAVLDLCPFIDHVEPLEVAAKGKKNRVGH